MERTQEEKVLSGLAHVAVFFSWIGLAYNLVIYFIYKEKSAYVASHAKQALGLMLTFWILTFGATLIMLPFGLAAGFGAAGIGSLGRTGAMMGLGFVGVLMGLVVFAISIGALVLVIMAAIRGFKGEEYRYPVIGDFVAKLGI